MMAVVHHKDFALHWLDVAARPLKREAKPSTQQEYAVCIVVFAV